jgi:hypothetical protein
MINFLNDFWSLLSSYKLRGYYGDNQFAIPLSTLFVILLFILFISL